MRTNLCRGRGRGREPQEAATAGDSRVRQRAQAIRNHLLEQQSLRGQTPEPGEVAGRLRRCWKSNERGDWAGRRSDLITLLIQHHPKDLRSRPNVLSTGGYGRQEVGEKAHKPQTLRAVVVVVVQRERLHAFRGELTSRPSRSETSLQHLPGRLPTWQRGDASKARSVTGPSNYWIHQVRGSSGPHQPCQYRH